MLSKIDSRCAASLEGFFEAKNAEMVLGGPVCYQTARDGYQTARDGRALRYQIRKRLLHLVNGMSVMCVRNFGDEKWPDAPLLTLFEKGPPRTANTVHL